MRGKTFFLSCFGCISPTNVDVNNSKRGSKQRGSLASEALFRDNSERASFEINAQHSETNQGRPPERSSVEDASTELGDSVISQNPTSTVQEICSGETSTDTRGLTLSLEEHSESESPFNALSLSEERRRVAVQETYLRNLKSGDLVTGPMTTVRGESADERTQEAPQSVVVKSRDIGPSCHPVLFNTSSLLMSTIRTESFATDDGDLHLSDME